MLTFIGRRLLLLPFIFFAATLLVFVLLQGFTPEERVTLFIEENVNQIRSIEDLIRIHGLDRPVWEQWFRWIGQVLQGNFGWSQSATMPVFKAIMTFFPATVELVLISMIPIILGGIWLGTMAAKHKDRTIDRLTRITSICGWSIPGYVLGIVLLMIFSGNLGWITSGRVSVQGVIAMLDPSYVKYTGFYTLDSLINGRLDLFWDALTHLILPMLTMAVVNWSLLVRITRSSMLNALREEYISTARAKGLSEHQLINKHAKRNALIPIVTMTGLLTTSLLNSLIIIETVFNLKGLGFWFGQAALQLDISAILGFSLFNGMLIVIANLIVDVAYFYLNPRLQPT